jgi:hypothetical protein
MSGGVGNPSVTASRAPAGGGAIATSGLGGVRTATIGQAVTVEGLEITVLKAEFSRGLEFQKPAAGYVYVAFRIRVKAVSETQFVSSTDWTALADGTRQGQSAFVVNDAWTPSFPFDELRQGASAEGWVEFEVPTPTSFVRLIYEPSFFSDEVKLSIDTTCCS